MSLPTLRHYLKRSVISAGMATRAIPYGSHFLPEITRRLPKLHVGLIFDVGANVGQTVSEYRPWFPDARIVSFEPSPASFAKLAANFGNDPLFEPHNMALADKPGRLRFDDRSPVTEIHALASDQHDATLPEVEVSTIDHFCSARSIKDIDLLKIDTEGHDLNVLRGAIGMIKRSAVSILVAECSLTGESKRLVQFPEIHAEMLSHGYKLFGLYQQRPGHEAGPSFISWANCAYVSPSLISKHSSRS